MHLFRVFKINVLVFFNLKRLFFDGEYRQTYFSRLLFKKKNGKSQTFDENHGLIPLEKCNFFEFLKLIFLLSRKAFFLLRISSNTFSLSILLKIKR